MIAVLEELFNSSVEDFRNKVLYEMSMCGIPFDTIDRIAIESEDVKEIIDAIKDISISNILEVGAYSGFSTIVFRVAFPEAMITTVDPNYVIDADVPSEYRKGIHVKSIFNQLVKKYNMCEIKRFDAYFSCVPQTNSLMFHKGFNENIYDIPIIGEEELLLNGKYDFIFIDGDHYSQSVYCDLTKSEKLLKKKGIIVLHDMKGKWGEEVKKGIDIFLNNKDGYLFKEVDNIAIIQEG